MHRRLFIVAGAGLMSNREHVLPSFDAEMKLLGGMVLKKTNGYVTSALRKGRPASNYHF